MKKPGAEIRPGKGRCQMKNNQYGITVVAPDDIVNEIRARR